MREIIFDTETTGIDPLHGHRIVEIGCIELIDYLPSGKTFHAYLNPERDVPQEVVRIHGLTTDFLQDKPKFKEILDQLLDFIGEDTLIAHNAAFDMNFLNAELRRQKTPEISAHRVIDTLQLARKKFPNQSNSLDALCQRFNIDNSHRTTHGALLDSELLAEIYLELRGGRQQSLSLLQAETKTSISQTEKNSTDKLQNKATKIIDLTELEIQKHQIFVTKLNKDSQIWNKYQSLKTNE